MKSAILSLLFCVSTVLLWTPSVIANSFTTSYAGIEGYQWLEFNNTLGKSREYVENNLLGNAGFEDYRYANLDETALFIEAVFGDIQSISKDTTTGAKHIADFAPPLWLTSFTTDENRLNNNGYYNFKEVAFYYGAEEEKQSEENTILSLYGHFCFYDFESTTQLGAYAYDDIGFLPITTANIAIASLLVRTPPYHEVPEPSTAALFYLGIIGIFTSKRKK